MYVRLERTITLEVIVQIYLQVGKWSYLQVLREVMSDDSFWHAPIQIV